MLRLSPQRAWLLLLLVNLVRASADPSNVLPGTQLLEIHADLSREMIAGIDRFALRELERSIDARAALWNRDRSSPGAFDRSANLHREQLRRIIGTVDERVAMTGMEMIATTTAPALIAEAETYTVTVVRWPVFEHVYGEGLLLQPKGKVRARIVALPDADQTPEMLAGLAASLRSVSPYARQLAQNGVQVVIPVLIDRGDEWSGSARLNRFTNLPHREWIYRQAYEMGRHIIGYEVQKVFAAVDWFAQENKRTASVPIGVAGYGEGALIAFHATALDLRINAALISGYFDSRQKIWEEPIYRNVFGLLAHFGDAEIASLVAPRTLIIEHCPAPLVDGPPDVRRGRGAAAAPGVLATPPLDSVKKEFKRAESLCGPTFRSALQLCIRPDEAVDAFWSALSGKGVELARPGKPPAATRKDFDVESRQRRQISELEEHTQKLVRLSEEVREQFFWQKLKRDSPENWRSATSQYKTILWNDIFGRLPAADRPMNPRTRKFEERRTWTGYEVVLDVLDDVFAWGYLLLPKDLRHGERRPVVVCQHGLEGLPGDTVTDDKASRAFGYYRGYAA
ncbi:MAG: alpha/beta hydrolase family protein, partial [Opitutaceae bacterium]